VWGEIDITKRATGPLYVLEIHELLTGKTPLVRWKAHLWSHQNIDATNKIIDVKASSGHDAASNNFNVSII
jgi:hypothetical protein